MGRPAIEPENKSSSDFFQDLKMPKRMGRLGVWRTLKALRVYQLLQYPPGAPHFSLHSHCPERSRALKCCSPAHTVASLQSAPCTLQLPFTRWEEHERRCFFQFCLCSLSPLNSGLWLVSSNPALLWTEDMEQTQPCPQGLGASSRNPSLLHGLSLSSTCSGSAQAHRILLSLEGGSAFEDTPWLSPHPGCGQGEGHC